MFEGHGLTKFSMRKSRRTSAKQIAYILLILGFLALILSIVYLSTILVFIGLGLTFWGTLFLFITTTKYVQSTLLNNTTISAFEALDETLTSIRCKGKAIYLPRTYVNQNKKSKILIPSTIGKVLMPPDGIVKEDVLQTLPKGMCIVPLGQDLANLFEHKLNKRISGIPLSHLGKELQRLFVEDLEIAKSFEMNANGDFVSVEIMGSVFKNLCDEIRRLRNICDLVGCPLCSSMAVIIAEATGKRVSIEKHEFSRDGASIKTYYRIQS